MTQGVSHCLHFSLSPTNGHRSHVTSGKRTTWNNRGRCLIVCTSRCPLQTDTGLTVTTEGKRGRPGMIEGGCLTACTSRCPLPTGTGFTVTKAKRTTWSDREGMSHCLYFSPSPANGHMSYCDEGERGRPGMRQGGCLTACTSRRPLPMDTCLPGTTEGNRERPGMIEGVSRHLYFSLSPTNGHRSHCDERKRGRPGMTEGGCLTACTSRYPIPTDTGDKFVSWCFEPSQSQRITSGDKGKGEQHGTTEEDVWLPALLAVP